MAKKSHKDEDGEDYEIWPSTLIISQHWAKEAFPSIQESGIRIQLHTTGLKYLYEYPDPDIEAQLEPNVLCCSLALLRHVLGTVLFL